MLLYWADWMLGLNGKAVDTRLPTQAARSVADTPRLF